MKSTTLNPHTLVRDDAGPSLVLLTHGEDDVLVQKPDTFREMIPIIRQTFNLDNQPNLSYYITSCMIHPGKLARVSPLVLEFQNTWDVIDHLLVKVEGKQHVIPAPVFNALKLSTQKRKPRHSIPIDPQDAEELAPKEEEEEEEEEEETPGTSPQPTIVKKERLSDAGPLYEQTLVRKDNPKKSEVFIPKPRNSQDSKHGGQSKSNSGSNSDGRFNFIVLNQLTGKEQQFRGRGSYTIQKVLDKIGPVLGVDPKYARLVQYMDMGDDDGEPVAQPVPCDGDSTLSQCGVQENSVLVIEEV